MTRNERRQQVSSNGNEKFDSFFEWSEKTCCPAAMQNYQPEQKPDTLDYIFEHVESFSCRQDEKDPDAWYHEHGIKRDNSLIDAADEQTLSEQTEQKIKPFGQQGDFVDYVFENAESYVCSESIPTDEATLRSGLTTVEARHENYAGINPRIQHVYEPEDEIQLYFRPKRGKRRSQKAEF